MFMRLVTRKCPQLVVLVSLLGAALVTGASVAPATAGTAYGDKVDSLLAALAASGSVTPDTQLRVIVFGSEDPGTQAKLKVKRSLGLIGGASGVVTVRDLIALASEKGIKRVALDVPMQATTVGVPVSFPALATQYPAVDGIQAAWNGGYTGEGIGVAVIDSGSTAAADFGTRLTQVILPGQTSSVDTYGHGTFVSSVLAGSSSSGQYVGVAPGTNVYAIDAQSTSGAVYSSDVIAGLNWVLSNATLKNIRVVNISLAETVASSYLTSALDCAAEQLWRAGVVVVASAGNLGPGTMQYAPANDPFVLTVGATDTNNTAASTDDFLASFSSNGTTGDGFVKPELLAPGRKIAALLPTSTTLGAAAPAANIVAPGYATMSGTSFSAPQVAGAAALLLQQHPTWTPDQVKWVLAQTARPVTGVATKALDLAAAMNFTAAPGSANVGIAPSPLQSAATVTTVVGNTSGWNTSGWNTSGWNSFSWD
jgi:serine protease AprX